MFLLQALLTAAHQLAILFLALYGIFILSSIGLYLVSRSRHDWPESDAVPVEWPRVTVQLPIYNEPDDVIDRLLRAVAALDYPADRLQIQVLDDSRDRPAALTAALVARMREQQGLDIHHCHRQDRRGYKGGALAEALPTATGDYIAVFDSDFVPEEDWLRRTVPAMLSHPLLAFVQTRWGHLNRSQNLLTAAQGLALDGHFVIEQQARSASGLWQGFNGSGGLWRRAAIDAAGGWSADTVTEDLDLSYRAQLQGWRGAYLNCVQAPGELPPLLTSFKRQQRRWAKGSMQTLRKLVGRILSGPWPVSRRLYALAHLGGYALNLPLLVLLAVTLPLALQPDHSLPFPALGSFSFVASVAPLLLYGLAQQQLVGWAGLRRLWVLPVLTLMMLGLSPALGLAVVEGAVRRGGTFERTPKQGQHRDQPPLLERVDWRVMMPEIVTFLFALTTVVVVVAEEKWSLMLLPLFYSLGCGFVLVLEWREYGQSRAGASPSIPTGRLRSLAEAIPPSDSSLS